MNRFRYIEEMKRKVGEMLAERFLQFKRWDGIIVDRRQQLEKQIAELEEEISRKDKEKSDE